MCQDLDQEEEMETTGIARLGKDEGVEAAKHYQSPNPIKKLIK